MHKFPDRFRRDFRETLERGQAETGDVILRWNVADAPEDRNVEADRPEADYTTETVSALVHWVSMRAVQAGLTIFKAGDAIVTFDGEVELENKTELSFTLPDGKIYVQAAAGREVAEWWDVFVGGAPLTKTLLLRVKA